MSHYSPQSNGFIERQHRTLKNALKARGTSWLIDLPVVLLGLGCLKNENGLSAFEAVTGTSLMLPHSLFSESGEFSKSPLDFIQTLAKNLSTMDFAVMSEGIHHAKHLTTNLPDALKTCTHVWVRVDRVRRALKAPYTGPFEVLDRNDRTFTIRLLNGKSESISIGRLKPTYLVVRSN